MTNNRGFTLIEVMIAIALLGTISAALLTFLPTVVNLNRKTNEQQTVTVAAKDFFEQVQADWKDSTNFQGGKLASGSLLNGYSLPNTNCRSSVTDPDGTLGIRKRVTVTCTGFSIPFIAEYGKPL